MLAPMLTQEQRLSLQQAKRLPLILLLIVTAGFIATALAGSRWGMVGALADWFAVSALFRRIPLPLVGRHTAIIPRNKDRIGQNLATFVRDKFLDAPSLVALIERNNPAQALADWLTAPANSQLLGKQVARLALAAVLHHDDTLENIGRAIEDAGLEEIPRMERGLGWLATLARITPMIGLLGTVLGMMDVLLAARQNAPLVQSADLTGGLWAALSATALSLVISILAYAGYNLLVSRVESILLDMERSASSLMNFMRQWRQNREAPSA